MLDSAVTPIGTIRSTELIILDTADDAFQGPVLDSINTIGTALGTSEHARRATQFITTTREDLLAAAHAPFGVVTLDASKPNDPR